MNGCETRERYLDRALRGQELAAFERHLVDCTACQRNVGEWRAIEQALSRELAEHTSLALPPASALRAKLVRRVAARQRSRWGLVLAPVALAMAAIALMYVTPRAGPESLPLVVLTAQDEKAITTGAILEASHVAPLHARLGPDHLVLAAGSKGVILEATTQRTRISLDAGRATLDVARRGARDVRIATGLGVEVRVTGTRFSVAANRDETEVLVVEGSVEVSAGSALTVLRAGEAAVFGSAGLTRKNSLTPAAVAEVDEAMRIEQVEPPSYDVKPPIKDSPRATAPSKSSRPRSETASDERERWRASVSGGACASVMTDMRSHVEARPKDAETWSLIADCERKQENTQAAFDSYARVVAHGDGHLQQRARYLAAEIALTHTENPSAALALLGAYLENTSDRDPLAASARLRYALALLALERREEAITALDEVVGRHPGTSAAAEARRILAKQVH